MTRKQLEDKRDRLIRKAPDLAQLLRGSLFERKRRCGNPSCHCAQGEGHPTTYVGVAQGRGQSVQVTVPPELLPLARTWTDNYRQLWQLIEDVSTINREILRRRLVDGALDEDRRPARSTRKGSAE